MTSGRLAVSARAVAGSRLKVASSPDDQHEATCILQPAACNSPLDFFAKRVGAEAATLLQVGTPFDYERQMKLFVVRKMPDPREECYREALIHWIEHFVRQTHGKAFVLFTSYK